jgi:hypothetical protein
LVLANVRIAMLTLETEIAKWVKEAMAAGQPPANEKSA